jgi:hypothetical protein
LDVWSRFADRIVVLDDGSTDDTADLCRRFGAEVTTEPVGMMGAEWVARKRLWDLAKTGSEWVLHLDADQIVNCDPRPFLQDPMTMFRVYDLWSPDTYRDDLWWTGHKRAWWPSVHVPSFEGWEEVWPERGWHSGHIPASYLAAERHDAGEECVILHYAYAKLDDRVRQMEKYAQLAGVLTPKEQFHAKTIGVRNPVTRPLEVGGWRI